MKRSPIQNNMFKKGQTVSYKKSSGVVLAFYKRKGLYNLNIQGKGYTDSFVNLSPEKLKDIKVV